MPRGRPRSQEVAPGKLSFEEFVSDKPEYLDQMDYRGEMMKRIALLKYDLEKLPTTKALNFPVVKFQELFCKSVNPKQGRQYVKSRLKEMGLKNVKVVEVQGIVHVTRGVV